MNIFDEIKKTLLADYESGMTQEELAKKHNISQVSMNRFLSGKRDFEKMEFGTFVKMFPKAEIKLNGNNVIGSIGTARDVSQTISSGNDPEKHVAAAMKKVMTAVMETTDLDADTKIKVLTIINALK